VSLEPDVLTPATGGDGRGGDSGYILSELPGELSGLQVTAGDTKALTTIRGTHGA
jgi:hypothetical protein